MKIALFGSTGGTGLALIAQALERGHQVTALARRPERLRMADPRLKVVTGDACDPSVIDTVVGGQEVVVATLGTRPWSYRPVCSQNMQQLAPTLSRRGVRRLICVSSFGVGDSARHMSRFW